MISRSPIRGALFVAERPCGAEQEDTERAIDPAASSRLLSKLSGSGHGGGTIYPIGSTEYATILAWIQQGAPP